MKNLILAASVFALAGLQAKDLTSMQIDNGGHYIMNACIGNTLFQSAAERFVTRDFREGTTGARLKIFPNTDFKDYDSKCGAVSVQGSRFWLIGGEGTVDNKKYQSVPTILTGTVDDATGMVEGLRKVSPLPFPARHGRSLIVSNRLYYIGGTNHNELISAEIRPDGELGEWKRHPAYPTIVAAGGFVCLNNVLYANGKATWKQGSSKMYALKLKNGEPVGKWEQVDSPEEAQGYMFTRNGCIYYFDMLSGNIYKTSQDEDGVQLKEWEVAGKMPCPPKSEGVCVVEMPEGYLAAGGFLPKTQNGKFAGFFGGAFIPFKSLK